MKKILIIMLMIGVLIITGCAAEKFKKPSIKDDFCGVEINYQYCKCAFHDEFCENIGMEEDIAEIYVQAEYDIWVADLFAKWIQSCYYTGGLPDKNKCKRCKEGTSKEECGEKTYGINEIDGKLYINSRPGETLNIEENKLPDWAKNKLVVVGAGSVCVGPPSTIKTGDPNVLYKGLPVARIGDETAHGGAITEGSDKIYINGIPAAYVGAMTVCPMVSPGPVPHIGGPIMTPN